MGSKEYGRPVVSRTSSGFTIVAGDFVKTGGMDRANYALADYVSRAGRDVELVTHRAAPELAGRANVSVRRAPKPLGSYMLGDPLLDALGRRAVAARRAAGGVALVNGGNCPVPAVNWVHYVHAAYRPEAARTLAGVRRSAYGVHARRQERLALRRAELVIANSAATKRVLVERLGADERRVAVVYYGLDAAAFAPNDAESTARARAALDFDERPLVAFIGALGDRRKGLDTVFDAFRELCRNPSWDADLVVIGAGPELPAWRERVARAGLSHRIHLLGFRRDVPAVLAACDALVAPTRYEAFGLGVLEALAKGLPALVSRGAGVAELYPDELRHLLLDDPESARELAQKLARWRAEREVERERMLPWSARLRARGWDDMAAEIVSLIEERR